MLPPQLHSAALWGSGSNKRASSRSVSSSASWPLSSTCFRLPQVLSQDRLARVLLVIHGQAALARHPRHLAQALVPLEVRCWGAALLDVGWLCRFYLVVW